MAIKLQGLCKNQLAPFPTMNDTGPRLSLQPRELGSQETDRRAIGIDDIADPYSGAPPVINENEVPVFWACGVTPQIIVEHARPSICITHKPGHMLITDRLNTELAD